MLNNTIHKNKVEIMSELYQKIRKEAKKKIEENELSQAQIEIEKIGQGFSKNENLPNDDFNNLTQLKIMLLQKEKKSF